MVWKLGQSWQIFCHKLGMETKYIALSNYYGEYILLVKQNDLGIVKSLIKEDRWEFHNSIPTKSVIITAIF